MELFLQRENQELSKPKKDGVRNPTVAVGAAKLKDFETLSRENIALINYGGFFSQVITNSLETISKGWDESLSYASRQVTDQKSLEYFASVQKKLKEATSAQFKALTRLSQVNDTMVKSNLHMAGLSTLLRREAVLSNLNPALDSNRKSALRNSSFLSSQLFESELISEGEEYLLKKGALSKGKAPSKGQSSRFQPYPSKGDFRAPDGQKGGNQWQKAQSKRKKNWNKRKGKPQSTSDK